MNVISAIFIMLYNLRSKLGL